MNCYSLLLFFQSGTRVDIQFPSSFALVFLLFDPTTAVPDLAREIRCLSTNDLARISKNPTDDEEAQSATSSGTTFWNRAASGKPPPRPVPDSSSWHRSASGISSTTSFGRHRPRRKGKVHCLGLCILSFTFYSVTYSFSFYNSRLQHQNCCLYPLLYC